MSPQSGTPVSRNPPARPVKPDEADKNEPGVVNKAPKANQFSSSGTPPPKVRVEDIAARDGLPFMPEGPAAPPEGSAAPDRFPQIKQVFHTPTVPSERQIQSVVNALYTPLGDDFQEVQACAILDGASVPGLTGRLDASDVRADCLYRGELDAETAVRAPYLVRFSSGRDPFLRWILEDLSDRHWGIFATAPVSVSFEALRRHFRRFLKVKAPTGETWLFRYYDPRVLRVYLPTCLQEEWEFVYGPVRCFYMQNAGGEGLQSAAYSARDGFVWKTLID